MMDRVPADDAGGKDFRLSTYVYSIADALRRDVCYHAR
jgi:hypothetical protein